MFEQTAVQIQKPLCLAASSLDGLDFYTCTVQSEKDKDPLMFDSTEMPCAIALT